MTTTTTPKTKRDQFIDELCETIANEQNPFDMQEFVSDDVGYPAGRGAPHVTCGTARCIAGHIWGLHPERAQELAAAEGWWSFESVAARIWRERTGDAECPLDFYGVNAHDPETGRLKDLEDITREEAVAHIRGVCPTWPQLDDETQ